MRFIHTSDLHIGKVVNGFSMIEEQKHALKQILDYAVKKEADALFLSGDLYDRSVPPAFAVSVLDDFLTELVERGIGVFAIAGNHDSGERLSFGSRILEHKRLYLEGTLGERVRYADISDRSGTVRIHLLPDAKPAQVRALYRTEVYSYEESMREILKHVDYLPEGTNILLAHQFVMNQGKAPEITDSESRVSVGGADQVESGNFDSFDYVALGHLHGSQQIGTRHIYYSGSPVKYSFSEAYQEKTVILGEIWPQGHITVEMLPITPVHDMRRIRGRLADLIRPEIVEAGDPLDYILAILTNEEELMNPIGTLRSVYPNVMQLQLDRKQHNLLADTEEIRMHTKNMREKTPLDLFVDFFDYVTGKELSKASHEVAVKAIDSAKEGMG